MNSPLRILLFSAYQALVSREYSHNDAVIYSLSLVSFWLMLFVPALVASVMMLYGSLDFLIDKADLAFSIAVSVYFASIVGLYISYFSKKRFKIMYAKSLQSKFVKNFSVHCVLFALLSNFTFFFFVLVWIALVRFESY